MRGFYRTFLIFSLFITPLTSQASESPIPEELLYKNIPISPACFDPEMKTQSIIKLEQCMGDDSPSVHTNSKGWITAKTKVGSSQYKIIGEWQGAYFLHWLYNTGGSGMFSIVLKVKKQGSNLQTDIFMFGHDRCNRGIHDIALKQDMLAYSEYLTAGDMIELSGDNPHHLKPYDDLDACAVCCIGSADFEKSVGSPEQKPVLKSVRLSLDNFKPELWRSGAVNTGDHHAVQHCFDQWMKSTMDSGKKQLNPEEFKQFIRQFNEICFKQEGITQ